MILFTPAEQTHLQKQFPFYSMLFVPSLDSTNLECQRRFQTDPSCHWLILADEQTGGRGRYGRSWESAPGVNIYLSFVWDNPFSPWQIGSLNLLFGLLLWEALRELYPLLHDRLTIKWPNDLYIVDKKLCGILIQTLTSGMSPLVIGMGINVYSKSLQIPDTATSLLPHVADLGNRARAQIVQALLTRLHSQDFVNYCRQPGYILEKFGEAASLTRRQEYTYHAPHAPDGIVRGRLHQIHPDATVAIITTAGKIENLVS